MESRQDLLEASEWYLEAQGHRRNQEYQDALEDPEESEEGDRVGSSLYKKKTLVYNIHIDYNNAIQSFVLYSNHQLLLSYVVHPCETLLGKN